MDFRVDFVGVEETEFAELPELNGVKTFLRVVHRHLGLVSSAVRLGGGEERLEVVAGVLVFAHLIELFRLSIGQGQVELTFVSQDEQLPRLAVRVEIGQDLRQRQPTAEDVRRGQKGGLLRLRRRRRGEEMLFVNEPEEKRPKVEIIERSEVVRRIVLHFVDELFVAVVDVQGEILSFLRQMDEAFVGLVQLVGGILFRPVVRDEADLSTKTRPGRRRRTEEILPSQTRRRAGGSRRVSVLLRHVETNFCSFVEFLVIVDRISVEELLVVQIGSENGFDLGGKEIERWRIGFVEVELIFGVAFDGEVFASVLAEVALRHLIVEGEDRLPIDRIDVGRRVDTLPPLVVHRDPVQMSDQL